MVKTISRIFGLVLLFSTIRKIFMFVGSGFSAIGSLFKRQPTPVAATAELNETQEISVEIIGLCEEETKGSDKTRNSGHRTTFPKMRLFDESQEVQPIPTANTAVVKASLAEADFYIEQDLLTDARIVLDELSKSAPNHQLLRAKRSHLNNVAKINRPDVVPPDDLPTRIYDYDQLAFLK